MSEGGLPELTVESLGLAGPNGRFKALRSGCGFVTTTWGIGCPNCGRKDLEVIELGGTGTVHAATVQTVPAEAFQSHAPYVYAIVDLPEGGRLSGWIPVGDGPPLRAGETVRIVPAPGGHRLERTPSSAPG